MHTNFRRISWMLLILFACSQLAFAAPVNIVLQKVRLSQTPEKVRIVFDLSGSVESSVIYEQDLARLIIDFPAVMAPGAVPAYIAVNDSVVSGVRITETDSKVRAIVELRTNAMYTVFPLKGPNRLVVDIVKNYEQKVQKLVVPGVSYQTLTRGRDIGPISAHILDIDPKAGVALQPLLSNNSIPGLESVKQMADRVQAIAAVNGSYFNLNGEILGLLKIDNELVSVTDLSRTALGILSDGTFLMDQVTYNGSVELPDGQSLPLGGVNAERVADEVVLYNSHYGVTTNTNSYGVDYVIRDSKLAAIVSSNAVIPDAGQVLSAHGTAAKKMARLKVGDSIIIRQSLGENWDKAANVIGAGPRLLKDGNIYITTKVEGFGNDVAGGRAPRTAVGITKAGHVLLVVVDGRQPHSVGLSLLELAQFMQELGAVNAMNLDGGGSSEMVLNGQVLNKPSDGRERRVGDALAVIKLAN